MSKKIDNYFIKRFIEQENKVHKMSKEKLNELKAIYREARNELESDLALFIERYANKNDFDAADLQRMLNTKEKAKFRYTIKGYVKEIEKLGIDTKEGKALKKELDIMAGRTRVSRKQELLTGINYTLGKAGIKSTEVIKNHLNGVVDYIGKNTSAILGNSLAKFDSKLIERIVNQEWNGENYSSRIWNNREDLAKRVMKDITVGISQGHDFKRMSEKLSKDMNVSYYQARRIIETETTGALENAKTEVYKEMGIEKYKFIATIDDRTSKICKELDGKIFDIKDRKIGINCPFMHPFCRSVTVPVIDEEALEKKKQEIRERYKEKVIKNNDINKDFKDLKNIKDFDLIKSHSNYILKQYNKIVDAEPKITEDMKSITKTLNLKLEGLDFRLKTKESLIRKVIKDSVDDGINGKEAFDKLKDIVRYTTILPDDKFAEKYYEMQDLLKENEYSIIKVKNTWKKGSVYKGINTTISKNNFKFEMQFHTKESIIIKEKIHKLYEEYRLMETSEVRKNELEKEMIKISEGLIEPKGVEKIK